MHSLGPPLFSLSQRDFVAFGKRASFPIRLGSIRVPGLDSQPNLIEPNFYLHLVTFLSLHEPA